MIGRPIDILIPEESRAAHRVHVRNFGTTGITSRSMYSPRTLNALRANGEQFPIKATISQVEAAGQKLFTVILRDLSERERAEDELRKAEKMAVAGRMAATVAHEINIRWKLLADLVDNVLTLYGRKFQLRGCLILFRPSLAERWGETNIRICGFAHDQPLTTGFPLRPSPSSVLTS